SMPAERQQPPLKANKATTETDWFNVIPKLKLSGLALNALDQTEFVAKDGANLILRVSKRHQSLFTPSTLDRIEKACSVHYQSPIKIQLNYSETITDSSAQKKETHRKEHQEKALDLLEQDVTLQEIQEEFSAKLVKNSVILLENDL